MSEMPTEYDLVVVNRGQANTFRRGNAGSIIDLTIMSPRLAPIIRDWWILEETTLSDHRYIEFNMKERSKKLVERKGGRRYRASWNTKRLSRDRLRDFLEETRLIDELG